MVTRVHKNLNKGCWSIIHAGSKVRHADAAALVGVRFVVQRGGLARVRSSGVRAVHAYATGTWVEPGPVPPSAVRVTYNPFRAETFHTDDGRPVTAAERVWFHTDGSAYAEGIH
jgi:phage tail sheath gpL-like